MRNALSIITIRVISPLLNLSQADVNSLLEVLLISLSGFSSTITPSERENNITILTMFVYIAAHPSSALTTRVGPQGGPKNVFGC